MSDKLSHVAETATFHEAFERQATLTPKAPAVNCEHVGLTFEQLNARANRVARRLIKEGVGAGSLVGLIAAPDPETIVGMLGIMKTGAAYVPVEAAGPKERLAYIAENAAVGAFVTVGRFAAEVPSGDFPTILLDDEALVQEDGSDIESFGERSSTVCVSYVSDSRGRPKPVPITHGDLLELAAKSNDSIYAEFPQASFRIGLKGSLTLPAAMVQVGQILFGRWLHFLPDRVRREVGRLLVIYLSEYSINALDVIPSDLTPLLEAKLARRMSEPGILLLRTDRVTDSVAQVIAGNANLSFYQVSSSVAGEVDVARISGAVDTNGFRHGDGVVDVYGYPVALGEVEAALRNALAGRDTRVVVQPDESGSDRIVAYVAMDDDVDIRNVLRRTLPEYMIPEAIVRVAAIPNDLVSPIVDFDRQYVDGFVSPRNRVEDALADMSARILGVSTVGVFDNFFELGGHSLLATQFVGQLQDYFPSEESLLSVFFQNPTIAALSAAIIGGAGESDVDQIADVILQVMNMSDEEVEAMLASGAVA